MTESVAQAIKVLKEGGLILYPTDTIWGIGCDATNAEAVAKVYALKQRDEAKSLVMLAADLDMVCRYVKQIPDIALQLVEVNDAPMTLIYPGAMGLAPNAIAEDGSVGIRIPMSESWNWCAASAALWYPPQPTSPASLPRNALRKLAKKSRTEWIISWTRVSKNTPPASPAKSSR